MRLLSKEELMSTQGIGASEVASILHLDPWRSAYQLWAQKTGRVPKPERTSAMLYGIEKEPEAFDLYKSVTGLSDMQRQICAQHETMPFLRAIADGWNGTHGVEIKCPTSPKLFVQVSEGEIPTHYLLQLAAEMSCFEVGKWDFFVWRSGGEYVLKTATMGDPFPGFASLNEYWRQVMAPALEDFNSHIDDDKWLVPGFAPTFSEAGEAAWREAAQQRVHAASQVEFYERKKDEAEATLKMMLGRATKGTAAGWRASWTHWQPTYELSIKVTSQAKLNELAEALKSIEGAEGIRDVKVTSRPENYVFRVQAEKEESQ